MHSIIDLCRAGELKIVCKLLHIRESVDSLCRDDADMPMPPYIPKAALTLHLLAFLGS